MLCKGDFQIGPIVTRQRLLRTGAEITVEIRGNCERFASTDPASVEANASTVESGPAQASATISTLVDAPVLCGHDAVPRTRQGVAEGRRAS